MLYTTERRTGEKMKAVLIHEPGNVSIVEIAKPSPKEGKRF